MNRQKIGLWSTFHNFDQPTDVILRAFPKNKFSTSG